MTEPETFRAELVEFLDRDLPRQLPDLPPSPPIQLNIIAKHVRALPD